MKQVTNVDFHLNIMANSIMIVPKMEDIQSRGVTMYAGPEIGIFAHRARVCLANICTLKHDYII